MFSIAVRLLRNISRQNVKYSIIQAQAMTGNEDIALHICQNFHFCDYLLGRGADINYQNHVGNTKLHNAVYNQDVEEVYYVLSKNPNLEIRNRWGYTPLIASTVNYNREIFRELLKNCNPNSSILIMGREYNSLQLLGEVADDDVILHYFRCSNVVSIDHSSYVPRYNFENASGKVISRIIV